MSGSQAEATHRMRTCLLGKGTGRQSLKEHCIPFELDSPLARYAAAEGKAGERAEALAVV